MSQIAPLRDIAGLGAWARRLLILQAAVCAFAIFAALARGPGVPAAADDQAWLGFMLLQLLVFIVGGIVVLRWTYLVTANAQAFGAEGMTAGPGMAVASYFIPIVNLLMPFRALRDVWKASIEPRDWEVIDTPPLLRWWWLFWLTGNISGLVADRFEDGERYPDLADVAAILLMVSDALTLAASVLLALIVRQLTALQQTRIAFG